MLSAEPQEVNSLEMSCKPPEITKKEVREKMTTKHDEMQYLELIQHILDKGTKKMDRTGESSLPLPVHLTLQYFNPFNPKFIMQILPTIQEENA